MGVVPVGALLNPGENIEILGLVQRNWVAVEYIENDCCVTLCGVKVGHELAVFPDANDIGDIEQTTVLLRLVSGRRSDVGICLAILQLDELPTRLTPLFKSQ